MPPPLGLSQARRMGCPSAVPFVGWGFDGCRWTPYPAPKTPPWGGRGSPGRRFYPVPLATGKSEPQRPSNPVPSGARGGAGARRNLKRPSPVVYSSPVHAKRCTRRANPGALPLGGLSLQKGEPRTPTREPDAWLVAPVSSPPTNSPPTKYPR